MQTTVKTKTVETPLVLAKHEVVKNELALIEPSELASADVEPSIAKQADALIDELYGIDPQDLREQQRQAGAVQSLGARVQAELARKSAMLKQPMERLIEDAEDGGEVAQSLLKLQDHVRNINPNEVNFDMGGLRALLAKLPGVGTPLSNWLAKYQSVEGVLGDIVRSLQSGRGQLERDNITLTDDQIAMRELTFKLQDYVKFGQLVDQRLSARVEGDTGLTDDRRKFLEQEIIFPLRQRVLDLQQQLAVNQQGVLTSEIIIRNNKELIRGVSRAVNVTVPALSTAATFALAAQTQKRVLKGVQAVTETTDELIRQTADKLKTQGVEIQKQASSTTLDVENLKAAFADVQGALDDISNFRRQALPSMANSIVEMDRLTTEMESSIREMEEGGKASDDFHIELAHG